uniref:inorganic diphosphatase n=1 Tax=Cacopsylla melanoneura TaxID=428564 RepID=A0A8D8T5I4_9HEMI
MAPLFLMLFLASSVHTLKEANSTSGKVKAGPDANETFRTQFDNLIEIENGMPNNTEGHTSPFHAVPLYADVAQQIFNMVADHPRWSTNNTVVTEPNGTLEGSLDEAIVDPHRLRFKNGGYVLNYGALPQTWADHRQNCPHTRVRGSGDPLYVIEIGKRIARRGEIIRVKVLGLIGAFIDKKIHWKVIAVDVNNPNATLMNDITDVVKRCGERMKDAYEWLEYYKVPHGGKRRKKNKLPLFGELMDREFALQLIAELNFQWHEHKMGRVPKRSYMRRTTTTGRGRLLFAPKTLDK